MKIEDKELRAMAVRTAMACPSCGALLHMEHRSLSKPTAHEIAEASQDQNLRLVCIEDAEEHTRDRNWDPALIERFRASQ